MFASSAPKYLRIRGLGARLGLSFLAFVVVGSIGLTAWLETSYQRESRRMFMQLASTNADFITRSQLARTELMAQDLGRILNLEVYFRDAAGTSVPPLASASTPGFDDTARALRSLRPGEGVQRLGRTVEVVAAPLGSGASLLLLRRAPEPGILRPATLCILAVFWLLTLALAAALTSGLVRPLRLLAERLPHIEEEGETTLPGAEREDEIGLLARTYLATHAQLRTERERRENAERLALLGRMATGLAHEIHNPISAVRMHLQLVQTAAPREWERVAAESLPVALEEVAKIEGLVNQWMFIAKPEPPLTALVDLGGLVTNAMRTLQPLAGHAGVRMEREIKEALWVRVDARRMAQAIGNIMLNGIQAMPGGGLLRLAGSRGATVNLAICDQGAGFSWEALARHGELFFSEKEGGMGIGLNVAAGILKAHGGTLQVFNSPGGGACVTLALPVVEAAP